MLENFQSPSAPPFTKMSVVSQVAKRIVPLFDRVLIQRVAAETRTKGGLLIPEKAQTKGMEGTVVAVGPGARTEAGTTVPLCVAVGDKVLLPEYGGSKIEMEGEEFQMFRETDIMAKLS
jgi:chaperonin GroES